MTSDSLFAAALTGDVEALRHRLDSGADPDCRDQRRWTPLMLAAMAGHLDVMQALLAAGADVNAQAADGSTPVLEAALWGHDDITQLLLAAGANPDVADDRGWTARRVLDQRPLGAGPHSANSEDRSETEHDR